MAGSVAPLAAAAQGLDVKAFRRATCLPTTLPAGARSSGDRAVDF
jgi:hypothetical protein